MKNFKNLKIRNSILLVLTALIWGIAFVAQSEGGDAVGPYTFNCVRSIIGGLVLLPVIYMVDKINKPLKKMYSEHREKTGEEAVKSDVSDRQQKKNLITGGVMCGVVLFFSSTFQQIGLYMGTPAGKAGFITACYILIVPILGLFFKKKCGLNIWMGVFIALIGLYLLCMNGTLKMQNSDILVLICALLFSIHILVVDHFSPLVDGVKMSCIQFFVCGTLGCIPMFFVEMHHSLSGIKNWLSMFTSWDAWIPILYAGVMSCGVAYTLQIIGQKGLNPTVASLLMSLESVFSVIAGWVILNQTMGIRELLGCGLLFSAIILAQLPAKKHA
jgi:drug/metabolite transporter (DMT)-like permease